MKSLPRVARIFVLGIYLAGAAAVVSAAAQGPGYHPVSVWEYLVYLVLGVLAGSRKVNLIRLSSTTEVGSMSLSFALGFAAILRFGPVLAMPVGLLSTVSGCLWPKRQALFQLMFNVALNQVGTLLAGVMFEGMRETPALGEDAVFAALVLACLTFYLINTGAVAAVIALSSGQSVPMTWSRNFLWTAPSYFVGAGAGYFAVLIHGRNIFYLLGFGLPLAYFTLKSYAIYTEQAETMRRSKEDLADLYLATVKSLALAIDAKDAYTHEHILRVQRYAVAIAERLGIQGDELEGLRTGALLHDIGKLGVPEYVLLKPGRLTDDEFAKIKEHPRIGADILAEIPFPWPVLPAVKYHHERWDGAGYPEGLAGEAIPLQGRVLAVADVYDALTSSRAYRDAWTHERAVQHIEAQAGTAFDPRIVEAFSVVIDEVVDAMAAEGIGPRAVRPKEASTQADRAVQDIQRASSELWALYEVAQTLSSSLGLEETIRILAGKLEAILPGTACIVLMREEGHDNLMARAAVGLNREFFHTARTVDANCPTCRAARTRQTYLGPYVRDDLLFASNPTAQWEALNAALIVPIVHQGEVLGTINLYHPRDDAFTEHDQYLLETIAARAALALYNGLLFERTRSHAERDTLTGLYNVRYLSQYIDRRCLPRDTAADRVVRRDDRFVLLCLDLDSFKPINDLYGHQTGDRVLRELAGVLRGLVRECDIVARYGGDEFLIVLEAADRGDALAFADRIKEAVGQYDTRLSHPRLGRLRIGVSVGVACYPTDGQDTTGLLSNADAAMYQDKAEQKLGRMNGGAPLDAGAIMSGI